MSQLLARRPYSSTLAQQLSPSKRLLERSCPWTQNLRKSKSQGGFLIILAYTILRKTLASIFGYPRILGRTKERPYLISGNPSDKSSAVPCCLLLMQDRTRLGGEGGPSRCHNLQQLSSWLLRLAQVRTLCKPHHVATTFLPGGACCSSASHARPSYSNTS